jgi:hypothetical protein
MKKTVENRLILIATLACALFLLNACKSTTQNDQNSALSNIAPGSKVVLYVSGGFDSCASQYMNPYISRLSGSISAITGVQPQVVSACFTGQKIALVNRFLNNVRHVVNGRQFILRNSLNSRFSGDADIARSLMGQAANRVYVVAGHSYGGTAAAYTANNLINRDPGAKVLTLTIDPIDPGTCAGGEMALRSTGRFLGTNGAGCRGQPRSVLSVKNNLLARGAAWVHVYQTAFSKLHSGGVIFQGDPQDANRHFQQQVPYSHSNDFNSNAHIWIKNLGFSQNQTYMNEFTLRIQRVLREQQ